MDPFEQKLRKTIEMVAYQDWEFLVGKDGIGLYYLQVRVHGPDVNGGDRIVWTGRKWRVSMHMTASEIVSTALKAVLTAEEHEARERFLYRGRAVFGPHLDVDRLFDVLSDDRATDVRS